MIWYTKDGNENTESIPPWEAVQRVKENNSPLCTSEGKNSPFSCSLQTQIRKLHWGCRESKRPRKSSWNWQTDSRSSSWVQQHHPFTFCKAMPAKTQACRALQLDHSLRWARLELEKNTKPSKSKHPNGRRMPSGTHTKLYICTINIPYFLMAKAAESAKQAGKNHYRASPS